MPDGIVRISVGLNTDTAIKDAQKLGQEVQATLNRMDTGKLDSKTLTFIKNLTAASNRAEKLARDLQALADAKIPTEEYKEIANRLKKAEAEFDKLLVKQDEMVEAGKNNGKAWDELDAKMEQIGQHIREDKAEMEQLVQSGKAFVLGKNTDRYKDMANSLNTANQATNILLEKYSEMGNAQHQVSQDTEEVTKATDRATRSTRAYGQTLGDVGKTILHSLGNALRRMVNVFKQLSSHLHSSNKGHSNLTRNMKHSLSTILRYTLGIRSIFMLVRRIRGYVKEAFKVMAQEIPEVNKAISELGTSFKQLKAGFGTMLQPLLQSLAPILNALIQKIVNLMNHIARFFATLTGQNYIYEATVANYDYAKSVEEAEKANEGALASFDKLNVIAKDNSKNTLALNKDTVTYKKVEINPEDSWWTRLAQKIAKGWKDADLSGVTNDIATKLAELLDSIKWEDIRAKTTKFAHTLATGINGITLPDEKTGKSALAVSIGHTIAEALQTAIDTFDTFITDINWDNLGKFIGDAIEALKDRLRDNDSWRKAGAAFGHLFQGLVKLSLQLLVQNNVFEGLGTDLSNFVNELIKEGMKINPDTNNTFIKDFGIALSTGLVNLLKEIEAFLDGSSNELAEAVNELFQGIDLFEIAKHLAIVFLKGLKTGLKLLLSAGLGALGITVDGDTAEFLAEALGIGLLGAKIAKLVGGITGSGGLLSAFSKKDRALGNQRRVLGLETVAVAALGTVLGWLGGKALAGSGAMEGLTGQVYASESATKNLTTASDNLATSIATTAEVGADACKKMENDTATSLNNMEQQFNNAQFKLNEVDTSSYSNAIATTQQTITTLENMWANAKLKAPKPTYETPPKTENTTQTQPDPNNVRVHKTVKDSDKQFVNDTSTVVVIKEEEKEPKVYQTTPLYDLQQQSIKATAELNNSVVDLEDYFGEFLPVLYQLYNDANPTKAGSAIEFSTGNEPTKYDIWKENLISEYNKLPADEARLFVDALSSLLDNYYNPSSSGSTKNYLNSLTNGLQNLLKWLPMAFGASFGVAVPGLAKGAVLPPNQPFLAMVGDQKSGTNVEAPLSTIEQAVANVLSRIQIKNVFDVQGDPNRIFKVVVDETKIFYNQHGYSPFPES